MFKLVEPEADEPDDSEEYLMRSNLRTRNADLGASDARYAGKKASRSSIAKQRGEPVEDKLDLR